MAIVLLAALPPLLAGWRDLSQARAASDPLAASAQYEQAARRLPWRTDLLEKAGQKALAGERPGQAARLFALAMARGALSRDGLVSFGDALWLQSRTAAATSQWEAAQAAGLQSAPLQRRLATAYEQREDFDAARRALERAVLLDPNDANSQFRLALLLAASRPDQSLAHFSRAAQLDPTLEPTIRPLREGIGKALLEDTPAGQLTMAGRALSAAGQLQLAAYALQAALEVDPKAAQTWALLGQVRESLGQDGLPSLQNALKLAPRDPQVQVMQGVFWLRRGDEKQALPHFALAAALDAQDPLTQAAYADALARTGDLNGAYALYQKAIDLDPNNADYWRLLANFSADYSYDVANTGLNAALKAQALEPGDYDTLVTLGRVALAQGQLATAGRFFTRALTIDLTQPAAALYLAIVAIEQNQPVLARDYLNHVLLIDPAGPYGQRARLLLGRYFSNP